MKQVLKVTEEKMQKSLSSLHNEYTAIRAGRANPAVLDKIHVDYYGVPTQINQMAAISVSEARVLIIQPWDISTLSQIEKAIQTSDLGINPNNDGKVIRIAFPPLTEDRRREIVKQVHKYAEECKVSMRNIRRDSIDKLKAMKKNSEVTEDDQKNGEKQIQTFTDKYCKEVDTAAAVKEKEIMEI
ncbi:MAG: ribosome recycling factor [Oscillospiraceae bacterium]|jgi:ribosome recycling factor|nr:ribosome recycling factor [Oscillospiraceae bacterium]